MRSDILFIPDTPAVSMLSTLIIVAQLAVGDSMLAGARNPAFAPDGRLALSIRGDLWIRGAGRDGTWRQVTSGPDWDRHPSWVPDGTALVFTSDRSGNGDIYRLPIAGVEARTPERITSSADPEGEPSVAPDGSMLFARGSRAASKIFLRTPSGTERRLTRGDGGGEERSPVWSPTGDRIAYSVRREDRTRLRVRWVAGDSDRVAIEDRDAEHPAWSPGGDRIAFSTRNGRAGVWITTPDVRYVNLLSAERAEAAWSPDGRSLALVELPGPDVGYNGDPDRLGDRDRRDDLGGHGRLWFVDAPASPDAGLVSARLPAGDATRSESPRGCAQGRC